MTEVVIISPRKRTDENRGTYQLWFLTSGSVMRRITHDANNYTEVTVTGDGSQMLATQSARAAGIWVGRTSSPTQAQQVISGPAGYDWVTWLSDNQLALDNEGSIWSVPAAGGQLKQLTGNTGRATKPCVTGDGRYVIFIMQHENVPNLWRMDTDGNNLLQLTKSQAILPSCSRSRSSVLFAGATGDKVDLWKVSVEGGEPVKLIDECFTGALSPDGKLLVYEFKDHGDGRARLAIKSLEEQGTQRVFDDATAWNQIRWAHDGRGFYYVSFRTGNLSYQPLTGGPQRTLIEHGKEYIFSLALSPDGEQLAYVKGTNLNNLVLISEFKSRAE